MYVGKAPGLKSRRHVPKFALISGSHCGSRSTLRVPKIGDRSSSPHICPRVVILTDVHHANLHEHRLS